MLLQKDIGVVIPTYQAESCLASCLTPLVSQIPPRHILVIDSSSTDRTQEIAHSFGTSFITIPSKHFNHGLTREIGRKHLQQPIVIFTTQDAVFKKDTIKELIGPLICGKASIAYGRQLPHPGASLLERLPRYFNYPQKNQLRSLADITIYGSYTFFCSNACAAYLNNALDEIGGFPETSFGEDTLVTAYLLKKGHKIAYVATAHVFHSHHYSLKQEFIRYIAIGKSRRMLEAIINQKVNDVKLGKKYAALLLKTVAIKQPFLIPYAILQTLVKWLGYNLGYFLKKT